MKCLMAVGQRKYFAGLIVLPEGEPNRKTECLSRVHWMLRRRAIERALFAAHLTENQANGDQNRLSLLLNHFVQNSGGLQLI